MAENPQRMSFAKPLWIAGIGAGLCAVGWMYGGLRFYWNENWNDLKLVNFLAAWIPFVLSILIAFVPEKEMTPGKKWFWRGSVIAMGFLWSVVLWHQQVITEVAASKDQERIVSDAVTKSNAHSDEEIGKVNSEVSGVRSDLKSATTTLGKVVQQTEINLNKSITSVGKPDPPKKAKLQFTFWSDAKNSAELVPIKEISAPLINGVVKVEFSVGNISEVTAEPGDIQVRICSDCTFAKEPEGFQHPKGQAEQDRELDFQSIFVGMYIPKMTLEIVPPPLGDRMEISFSYGCKNCAFDSPGAVSRFKYYVNIVRTATPLSQQ